MSLATFFRFISAAILLILLALIAVLTVIVLHGLCRSPFGVAGVSALLAHLDSRNMLNPIVTADNITRFFLGCLEHCICF